MAPARKGSCYQEADQTGRILKARGLPARYLGVDKAQALKLAGRIGSVLVPRPWAKQEQPRHVSVQKQRAWVDGLLLGDGLERSQVVGVGCEPTDELGMVLVAGLMRQALDRRLRVKCIAPSKPPEPIGRVDVLVLHGLIVDAHVVRVQFCRDWLLEHDDTCRVVVVGGADPYRFFYNRMFHPVDIALYLRGEQVEDLQR